MDAVAKTREVQGVVPLSLKDAPSLIEAQLPVNRISAEAYKERKAVHGQTLTALGSYWKGRKPLILVRAAVLASLLPATEDPAKDLDVFLRLMGMHDLSFRRRLKSVSVRDIDPTWESYNELVRQPDEESNRLRWNPELAVSERVALIAEWLCTKPYEERLGKSLRPEECEDDLVDDWDAVNAHLGTNAGSLPQLVEQLGIMRFGHRPRLADSFCGAGSIPFEAARMGCDVYASDLSPIACMLIWGALNIVGADEEMRSRLSAAQRDVAAAVQRRIDDLGIERDADGNVAKAYIYCLETRCPKTGWMVPMLPSFVVSRIRPTRVRLVPVHAAKRYDMEIVQEATAEDLADAVNGTVRNGRLVHPMNPDREGVAISVIRGDRRGGANALRRWEKSDFVPRPDDIFQERLYCIQWIDSDDLAKGRTRQRSWFAAPTPADLASEELIRSMVADELPRWQRLGFVPDMEIERGDETARLLRERGWTHWHHLFNPRHLLLSALLAEEIAKVEDHWLRACMSFDRCFAADRSGRLAHWRIGSPSKAGRAPSADAVEHVFYNQALNTFFNYGARSFRMIAPGRGVTYARTQVAGHGMVETGSAADHNVDNDIYVTDPPYADAVNYHEITEYFIAWLRRNPPEPFSGWTWDSRRTMAIQGTDEDFRRDMVAAYKAMSDHMPDNGLQVVMFTHQDAGVWADLAAIMWAAGLRVTAAWNIVTETESALKQGNYVQGTILLVLRKRIDDRNAKRMDIEMEVEDEVREQLRTLQAIDDDWTGETLYTDGDLQLAAYAAALRVITAYRTIDRRDVGADVYRKVAKGERTVIRDLIDYASSVANNFLIPEGCSKPLWSDLDPHSRFYFRMLDMEVKAPTKFADYQSFAKTFGIDDYDLLMSSTVANKASLAGATDFKGRMLGGQGFGDKPLRHVLFAIWKTSQKDDPREGVGYLRTELGPDYWGRKAKLTEIAEYVRDKTRTRRPTDSAAADLLVEALKMDRM